MSDLNRSREFLEALAAGRISGEEAERQLEQVPALRAVAQDLQALRLRLDELGTEGLIEAAKSSVDPEDLASSREYFGSRFALAARRRRRNQLLMVAAALIVLLGFGWRFVQDGPGEPNRDRFLGGSEAAERLVSLRPGRAIDYDLEFGAFDRARVEFFAADGSESPVGPLVTESWPWTPTAEILAELPSEGLLRVSHERSGERLFRFAGEVRFRVEAQPAQPAEPAD